MLQRSGIQGGTLIYCYWDTGMASTFPWSYWRPRWSAPVLRVWCNRNTEGHLKLEITPVPTTTLESVSWFWVTAAGPGLTFQISISVHMALRPCLSYHICKFSTKFSTQGGPRPTPTSYRRNYRCIAAVPNKSHKIRKFSKRQEQLCLKSGFSQSKVPYNSTSAQHIEACLFTKIWYMKVICRSTKLLLAASVRYL